MLKLHVENLFGLNHLRYGIIEGHCGLKLPPLLTAAATKRTLELGAAKIWGRREAAALIDQAEREMSADEQHIARCLCLPATAMSDFDFSPTLHHHGMVQGKFTKQGVSVGRHILTLSIGLECLRLGVQRQAMRPQDMLFVLRRMATEGVTDTFTDDYLENQLGLVRDDLEFIFMLMMQRRQTALHSLRW